MKSQKTIEMAEIALMSAVLCIVSPFTIPIPASPVPLSLATFAVYLAAVLLGGKRSVFCVLIYLLLGAVGLPVFSGFSGGIGVLLGPTGGYLLGYLLCAPVTGWLAARKGQKFAWNLFAMGTGTLVCYGSGVVWFLLVMQGSYSFLQAVLICVVPYLLFDAVKIMAAAAVSGPIKRRLRKVENI